VSRPVVLDSSVAVKWFKHEQEPGLAEALELLSAHRDEQVLLCAPTLLRLEVLNALRSGGLTAAQLQTVCEDLEGFRLAWHETSAELAASAAAIATRAGLTVYDALFVALARELEAELVTADRLLSQCTLCTTRLVAPTT
jgi:predicted nucleic acid-binding protein